MLFRLLLAALGLVGLLAVACNGNDDGERDGTGIAEVDDVIAAFESADAEVVVGRLAFQQLPCTHELGAGEPPKCLPSEVEGSTVEVFEFYSCEVVWLRAEGVGTMVGEVLALRPGLFAAFVPPDGYVPSGDHVLLFEGTDPTHDPAQPRGVAVAVASGRVRAILRACGAGDDASTLLPSTVVEFLVPPPNQ